MVLRKLDKQTEAEQLLSETLALDPLDYWANHLANRAIGNNQARLDVAFDLLRAGLHNDAKKVLEAADLSASDGSVPIVLYSLAYVFSQLAETARERSTYAKAATASPVYCFPSRLEELIVLEAAIERNPEDARAHFYLGNWLYDRRRHREAIRHWESAAQLEKSNSVAWRNLGIAYFNVTGNVENARLAFENAVSANPQDARLHYERDQLWKRTGIPVAKRLAEMECWLDSVARRDDLTVELAALHNQTGQSNKAAALLKARHFQPWEGGEGAVLREYVRAQLALSRQALELGETDRAYDLLEAALEPPHNLGEAWHLLANRSHVHYWLGVACQANGDLASAWNWWNRAAASSGDFQDMSVRPYSEMTYYSALALARLERNDECRQLLRALLRYARNLRHVEARIDYFATSLPAMLLFEEDLQKRGTITGLFLEAQAAIGLGHHRRGRRVLGDILRLDPSHSFASDLLSEVQTEAVLMDRAAMKV
jgi:tetratricopeptide (TPR) repeat protein